MRHMGSGEEVQGAIYLFDGNQNMLKFANNYHFLE